MFAVVPLVATMVPADTSSDLLREGMRPQALLDYFVAMKVALLELLRVLVTARAGGHGAERVHG